MYILYESAVPQDLAKLDEAWSEPSTFAFLPDRSAVWKEWVEQAMAQFPKEFHKNHFVLLTSGSTGQPKLVLGSRQRAENLASVLHKVQCSEPTKQTVLALPLAYCYAFVNQWLWSRINNRDLILSGGFKRPDLLKRALLEVEDGLLCLIHSQVRLFVSYYENNISFPGIIRLHFAGGLFPQNDIDHVKRLFPNARIFNNYGCAEAMPRLTIRPHEDSKNGRNIGKPLPGVQLKADEKGEIHFRSPYRAVAFCDQDGMNVPADEEWIPTGDLGEQLENGYWQITGRTNDVFKRYGEKISIPQLLKTVSSRWSKQAAFYRERDASGEEGHVLILAPEPTEEQVRNILQAFRKTHPRTHWPIRLESTASFPVLPNGKLDMLRLARITDKSILWRHRI